MGWSYSNRTGDRTVGDKRTAQDALKFLLGFFERFPELQDRPFWIAGESYGGVGHVPDSSMTSASHIKQNKFYGQWKSMTKIESKDLDCYTADMQTSFTASIGLEQNQIYLCLTYCQRGHGVLTPLDFGEVIELIDRINSITEAES